MVTGFWIPSPESSAPVAWYAVNVTDTSTAVGFPTARPVKKLLFDVTRGKLRTVCASNEEGTSKAIASKQIAKTDFLKATTVTQIPDT